MSSILSAISGQFSRLLILGTFMPVVLFVILNLLFVLPYVPDDPQVFQQISDVNTRAILVITFVTIVLTGLLYNLNTPIIRFYEGYTWQYSKIGQWRTRRYEKELVSMGDLRPRLQDVQDAMARSARNESQIHAQEKLQAQIQTLRAIRNRLARELNTEFPTRVSSVLPTKLGNVIRSFENYPERLYNMAGITLYPRLLAKIDKEYLGQIDNAKTSFDFMINCSLLSAVLAFSMLVAGLLYPIVLSAPPYWIYWLLKIFFFFFLSWGFYISSIGRAREWGDMVKSAFDLYRLNLLEQLGFTPKPANMEEERALWKLISTQIIYGTGPTTPRLLEYAYDSTSAPAEVEPEKLETAHGANPNDREHDVNVTLIVKNNDPQQRPARNVVLKIPRRKTQTVFGVRGGSLKADGDRQYPRWRVKICR